jgi:transposase
VIQSRRGARSAAARGAEVVVRREVVRSLVEQGRTVEEIAAETGAGRATTYEDLGAVGGDRADRPGVPRPLLLAAGQGMTNRQIEDLLGDVSRSTIARVIRQSAL